MRLPRMRPADLLVIKLWDMTDCNQWMSDEKAQAYSAMPCVVCGWFVNKDKEFIRITSKVCGDGDKTILVIPRGFLRSVRVILYDREVELI